MELDIRLSSETFPVPVAAVVERNYEIIYAVGFR